MSEDIIGFLKGFNAKMGYNLKDRMKTKIMQAKKGDKEYFIKELARDYINLCNEIEGV